MSLLLKSHYIENDKRRDNSFTSYTCKKLKLLKTMFDVLCG